MSFHLLAPCAQIILDEADTTLMEQFKRSRVRELYGYDYLYTKGKRPEKGALKVVAQFDSLGQITRLTRYESGVAVKTREYVYSATGLKKEDRLLTGDDVLVQTTFYTYDGRGNLLEEKTQLASGPIRFIKNTEWDEHNHRTFEQAIYREDTAIFFFENLYDSNGNLLAEHRMDRFGGPVESNYYRYDTKQRQIAHDRQEIAVSGKDTIPVWRGIYEGLKLVKEIRYTNEGKPSTTEVYEYDGTRKIKVFLTDHLEETTFVMGTLLDKQGRVIEEYGKYELDEKLVYRGKIKYDKQGRRCQTTNYDEDNKRAQKVRYKYDDAGNLIRRRYYDKSGLYRSFEYTLRYR